MTPSRRRIVAPRDHLFDPLLFGRADALWRPLRYWVSSPDYHAARIQHDIAFALRQVLVARGTSVRAWSEAHEFDPSGVTKKLSGVRTAELDDYLAWAHIEGAMLIQPLGALAYIHDYDYEMALLQARHADGGKRHASSMAGSP